MFLLSIYFQEVKIKKAPNKIDAFVADTALYDREKRRHGYHDAFVSNTPLY
jgi:hypothetical protein